MGEELTSQNSVAESENSRSSEAALISKFFPEIKLSDSRSRDRKYSRKYNVTEDFIEEGRNSFKWLSNHDDFHMDKKNRSERKSSHKHVDGIMTTLESNKTSSSFTASDFTSNVYSKNGYIRGTSDKKCGHEPNSTLKYNEFSSLMSSLGTGRNFPVEVKLDDKKARKEEEKRLCLDQENGVFLILGGIQMMLGILMAVFGVLVIAHDSSLSGAGSGLWGGAVAMFSGLMGILAGLKGCYFSEKHNHNSSRTLLTIFLALCLVSFALCNLVVVLTSTGLIRDVQRPKNQTDSTSTEEIFMHWRPVLTDIGLILASSLQCIAAMFSGYKCYKKVCPCLRNEHNRLSDADSHHDQYKTEGKELLVNQWLGQQFRQPVKKSKNDKSNNNLVPWGAPNIVLLPPPPPTITNGQIPILTFLQAPSSVFGNMYSDSAPCYCRHDNCCMINPNTLTQERRLSRKLVYIQPDNKIPSKSKNRTRVKKERRASFPTAEEVARTYTGLDREIAEEFIAIAMNNETKKSSNNSFTECAMNCTRDGY